MNILRLNYISKVICKLKFRWDNARSVHFIVLKMKWEKIFRPEINRNTTIQLYARKACEKIRDIHAERIKVRVYVKKKSNIHTTFS